MGPDVLQQMDGEINGGGDIWRNTTRLGKAPTEILKNLDESPGNYAGINLKRFCPIWFHLGNV